MENIKGSHEWPYNVWNIFTSTFPKINGEAIVPEEVNEKYLAVLTTLFDHAVAYVTTFCPYSHCTQMYYQQLQEHTEFAVWLFGQFVGVLFRERYSTEFERCLNTQAKLLRLLSQKCVPIFLAVIRCYISALKDMVNLLDFFISKDNMGLETNDEKKNVFKWFTYDTAQNSKCVFTKLEYLINNKRQCNRLINQFLMILTESVADVSYCCSESYNVLCDLIIRLLSFPKKSNSVVYRFVSSLISNCGYPVCNKQRNLLLKCIENEIKKLILHEEMEAVTEFCDMLKILTDKMPEHDFPHSLLYFETIKSTFHNNFIQTGTLTISVLNYIQKIHSLLVSDGQINVQLNNINLIDIRLYGNLVISDVVNELNAFLESNSNIEFSKTNRVKLSDVSDIWRNLTSKLNILMDELEQRVDISENRIETLTTLYWISVLSNCLFHRFMQLGCRIKFFDRFLEILPNQLLRLLKYPDVDVKILKISLEIIENLVVLPELYQSETLPDNNQPIDIFIVLLTMPWIFTSNIREFQEIKESVFPVYKSYRSLINAEIEKLCFSTLISISYGNYSNWLEECIIKKLLTENMNVVILDILPKFFYSASTSLIQSVFSMLCNNELDKESQFKFAKSFRIIICILMGTSRLKRNFYEKCSEFYCPLCDDDCESFAVSPDRKDRFSHVQSYIQQYLVNCMTISPPEIRYLIIDIIPSLFNHLNKIDYLDFIYVSEKCLKDVDPLLRDRYVEVLPYILFAKEIIESNNNRVEFMKNNRIKDVHTSDCEDSLFKHFMELLFTTSVKSLNECDPEMQYTSMKAVFRIGRVPSENTLFISVKIFVHFLITATSYYPAVAKYYIQEIAIAHGLTEDLIYIKYRDEILKMIVDILIMNRLVYGSSIQRCFHKFDYKAVFNEVTQYHILKFLMPYIGTNKKLKFLLNEISEFFDTSIKQTIINGFRHIYPHVILFESVEVSNAVVELIKQETDCSLVQLLSSCYTKVLVQFLSYFHDHAKNVEDNVIKMHQICSSSVANDLRACIEPKFLGVLMIMEYRLTSIYTPQSVRCHMLSSLADIINLMGKRYITSVRYKILATLKTVLSPDDRNLSYVGVKAWKSFVQCLDKNVLGPLLSTIVISLLPFYAEHSTLVDEIFRYLIIDNKEHVSFHINELYFINQTQCSKEVYRTVQTSALSITQKPIQERLERILRSIKHEISEIKLHGLKRLQMELAKYRTEDAQLMLASDIVNNLIFQILDVLIEGFRDNDERVQEACAECLGEIGAIDPSYLPHTIKKSDLYNHFPYNIEDEKFIMDGLTVLCNGFQAAKSSLIMDKFALAIQEFLNTYSITEGSDLWTKMSSELQEIMLPFCSTTYALPPSDNSESNLPHPIFRNGYGRNLRFWAYHWSDLLVRILPNDTLVKKVFVHCKSAISSHDGCLLFFLPHIVLHAVFHSNEEEEVKIYEEMVSIFSVYNREEDNSESSNIIGGRENLTKILKSHRTNHLLSSYSRSDDVKSDIIFMKTVFTLIELLSKALYEIGSKNNELYTPKYNKLKGFLDRFSKELLTEKAMECGEYARALLYMEDCKFSSADSHTSLLSKIYYHLNNTDDLRGILSVEVGKPKQPQDVVLLHEITDQFHDAAICYQKLLKNADEKNSIVYQKQMLQCYLAINQPQVALSFVNSIRAVGNYDEEFFNDIGAEALWNLSQFTELEELINRNTASSRESPRNLTAYSSDLLNENWGIQIGRSITHLVHVDKQAVRREICNIRRTIAKYLHISSVTFGGYRESYQHFIKLHILNEFEKIAKLVTAAVDDYDNKINIEEWQNKFQSVLKLEFEERLNKLQPVSRVLQPVLNMRRVLFSIAQKILTPCKPQLIPLFDDQIKKCWIKRIQIARSTRNFQLAYSNIIEAQNFDMKEFFIEKAKYHWDKSEHNEALRILKHGLRHQFPDISDLKSCPLDENVEERQLCAKALLLIGMYNDKMANIDLRSNLENFKDAVEVNKCSEKTLVKLANYKDKILNTLSSDKIFKENLDDYIATINYYGKSLDYGCEFLYQSMSRILSIWMDFGQQLHNDKTEIQAAANRSRKITDLSGLKERQTAFNTMSNMIRSYIKHFPPYFYFTAFSQVTSRICHPLCYDILKIIIINCIKNYPNQALWRFTSFLKSSSEGHMNRCKEILNDVTLKNIKHLIESYKHIFEKLSEFCSTPVSGHGNKKLSAIMKDSSTLLAENIFNTVMVPIQKYLDVTLPRPGEKVDSKHDPFPMKVVYIHKFKDDVYVFQSLQKPRKVLLIGSDGIEYALICKSEDDLRLDCRFMEFSSIVNMYLKRDTEARDRGLHIRTYSVLPLFSKCGIIEFISNLVTMRETSKKIMEAFGIAVSQRRFQDMMKKLGGFKNLEERKQYFTKELTPLYPPVLRHWYKKEFPNPGQWYMARCSYVHTLAVMSIVGYVMGLGDRHNDNILLDSSNGDVVHVDFNQLFNDGELLPVPDVMPFRLTSNMIDAMGPVKVEGMFIHACEIINRILRNHREQLLSVLNPFLYDPLLKWTDEGRGPHRFKETSSLPNHQGRNKIRDIDLRLDGVVRSLMRGSTMPLSVEGQTRRLIEEATNIDNLCSMYHGWGAFM